MAQASERGVPATRVGDRRWSPLVFALDRLFPKRGAAPYATAGTPGRAGHRPGHEFSTATRASGTAFSAIRRSRGGPGSSVASVKRMLQRHCDGPAPLFYRTRTGQTRGRRHACYRFTLVRHPESSSRPHATPLARNVARKWSARCAISNPNASPCSASVVDFGGTLTEAEYRIRLAALEKAAGRRAPARVRR